MLVVCLLLRVLLLDDASAAVVLQQRTLSVTKGKGRTARVTCHTSGLDSSFADDVFHWYQQRDGGEPKWMLLVGKGDTAATDDAFKKRFTSEKNNEAKACSLLINNVEEDDSATYCCARWERTATQSHRAPYKRRGARCAEWREAPSLHRCADSTSDLSGVRKYLGPPWLTPCICARAAFALTLDQKPLTVTRSRGRTARLTCALDVDISGATVHWYLHTDGEAPTHLLYVGSTGEAQYSEDEHKAKYRAEKTPLERKCSLQMYNVENGDSALYYCASWSVTAAHRRGGAAQKRTGEGREDTASGTNGTFVRPGMSI
ncbi:uncharacterized protein LOC127528346 [Erpetoichthys calabaricus]|uniref:uncharacterized protein LOC127528346 n=1 Tax=Erpetoichthys calabaricus TaxID=27687 RepID=UPI0022349E72|nr:uncharacterized protein LOC127528346 [Erpetoichthys calabaricus]